MKATPVPESSPRLPKTIEHTLTAVPRSFGMRSCRRYSRARSPFHEWKTAWIARSICSRGSCGNSRPVSRSTIALKVSTSTWRSEASRSRSLTVPLACLASSRASSNSSPSTPSTVLPNICTRRRYESQAKRSLPDWAARPRTEASESPMFRTVSIMPGMENLAPERTDTSSGSSAWPSSLPISCWSDFRWLLISWCSEDGSLPVSRKTLQASVVMMNPGGTGRPRLVISARFAPLPPRRSLRSLFPSVKE